MIPSRKFMVSGQPGSVECPTAGTPVSLVELASKFIRTACCTTISPMDVRQMSGAELMLILQLANSTQVLDPSVPLATVAVIVPDIVVCPHIPVDSHVPVTAF